MAKKTEEPAVQLDPNGWMVTFSDLVTLLLTFFVMLLTMNSMDNKKFNDVFSVFTDKVGVLKFADKTRVQNTAQFLGSIKKSVPGQPAMAAQIIKQARSLDVILGTGTRRKPGWLKNILKGLQVRVDPRGLIITMSNQILFRSATDTLTPASRALLKRIATFLAIARRPVTIEGHTDNIPLKNRTYFASNWELSLARAVTVLQFILAEGKRRKMGIKPTWFRVGGYGSTRPLVDNSTERGRRANRRVEMILDMRS
jgi:chemotaxis protein MotB